MMVLNLLNTLTKTVGCVLMVEVALNHLEHISHALSYIAAANIALVSLCLLFFIYYLIFDKRKGD